MAKIRVTIWNEFLHEKEDEDVKKMHPNGIHETLKKGLEADDLEIRTAWLDQDEYQGLSDEVLNNTDVLLWWGHMGHHLVKDETVERVCNRVYEGMGFIPLHSGHASKPFSKLLGTSTQLNWREIGEHCRIWCVDASHPIAQGVPLNFVLDKEECYCEPFMIPTPDELIFITWWEGGEIFRGGVTYKRGNGKIFYFHPGHETLPSYYNKNVLKVIGNAIRWAVPAEPRQFNYGEWKEPEENIPRR